MQADISRRGRRFYLDDPGTPLGRYFSKFLWWNIIALGFNTGLLLKCVLGSEGLYHASIQEIHGELSSNSIIFCELSLQIFGPFFIWPFIFLLSTYIWYKSFARYVYYRYCKQIQLCDLPCCLLNDVFSKTFSTSCKVQFINLKNFVICFLYPI